MKPQISINENNVRILTDQFDLNLTFGVNPQITEPTKPLIKAEIPSNEILPKQKTSHGPRKGLRLTSKLRICATCGKKFKPVGNRQTKCSIACGMTPKTENEKMRLKAARKVEPKEKEIPDPKSDHEPHQSFFEEQVSALEKINYKPLGPINVKAAIVDKENMKKEKAREKAISLSPDTRELIPIIIDSKTTIYVKPGTDVEEAKMNFITKHAESQKLD